MVRVSLFPLLLVQLSILPLLGVDGFFLHMRSARAREIKDMLRKDDKHRVLSIDGGGIRGALSAALRRYYSCDDLVLSDFFDVVGGTSTGSLIAAGLATEKTCEYIQDVYLTKGKEIFTPQRRGLRRVPLLGTPLSEGLDYVLTKYKKEPLEALLKGILSEQLTFSSPEDGNGGGLACKLFVVTECVTREGLTNPTYSTVFFNNMEQTPTYRFSKDVPVWMACRASSAAPTYFPPMSFVWDDDGLLPLGDDYAPGMLPDGHLNNTVTDFVDGGISGYNNPENAIISALTMSRYNISYPAGPDRLLLVSVGCGYGIQALKPGEAASYTALGWASFLIDRLMSGSSVHESLSAALKCYSLVDMDNAANRQPRDPFCDLTDPAAIARFDGDTLGRLGLGDEDMTKEALQGLTALDNVDEENVQRLRRVGEAVAQRYFNIGLLKGFL